MQAIHGSDAALAIKYLHDMSSQYLNNVLTRCDHDVQFENISSCEVPLPHLTVVRREIMKDKNIDNQDCTCSPDDSAAVQDEKAASVDESVEQCLKEYV